MKLKAFTNITSLAIPKIRMKRKPTEPEGPKKNPHNIR